MRDVPGGVRVAPYDGRYVPGLLALHLANRAYFAPWDPVLPASFYTRAGQEAEVRMARAQAAGDTRHAHVVLDEEGSVIGAVALSNVVRGAWQNATLGYRVAEAAAGRGLPPPQPTGGPGRQWYHPTLWQYLAGRRRGVR